jgi:hypothetical protein
VRSKSVIRDLMIEQIEAGRMPLKPVTISDEMRTVLLAWLKNGAPAVPPQVCQDPSPLDSGLKDQEAGEADSGDDSGGEDAGSDADASIDAPADG